MKKITKIHSQELAKMIRIYEAQKIIRLEMVPDTQAGEVSKPPVRAR